MFKPQPIRQDKQALEEYERLKKNDYLKDVES